MLTTDAGAGTNTIHRPHFEGHIVGAPESEVLLRIITKAGHRQAVRFEARNVKLACDDETTPSVDFAPIKLRLASARRFEGERYEVREHGQTFYKVKGRLRPRGRAQGFVFWIGDVDNPPGTQSFPDCSTPVGPTWTARRVR